MAKIKGTSVVPVVKFLRANRERARAVLPPDVHHYLDERIARDAWYSELDYLRLARGLVSLLPPLPPGGDTDRWAFMGREAAKIDVAEGVYRDRLNGAASALALSPWFWKNYHDSGELTATLDGDKAIVLKLRGFAVPSDEVCRALGGYLQQLTQLAGGVDVQAFKLGCRVRGRPECTWRFTWK